MNKWVGGLFVLYAVFSCFIIYSSVYSYRLTDSPRLFLKDPNAPARITAAIASDHNMAFTARILHNKVLVAWQVMSDSLYRSIDIPFLFSITERSALYDNPGRIQMLPFYELPFFIIALVYVIKRWDKMRRYGYILLGMFCVSLMITGLFWPFLFPVKLILLMITIQLLIFIGNVGFFSEIMLWRKK